MIIPVLAAPDWWLPPHRNIHLFSHKGALTAYAGVNPGANQSGDYEQQSVRTSKRGTPQLRKTLFLIMDSLMKLAPPDDPVYGFMMKKRAQCKDYYFIWLPGQISFSVFIIDESTSTLHQ